MNSLSPIETAFLFVGILLGVLVVAKVRDWPPFRITRTPVRIDPTVASEWRLTDSELRAKELRLVVGRDARAPRSLNTPAAKGFERHRRPIKGLR